MENGTKIIIGLGILVVAGGITYAVTRPKKKVVEMPTNEENTETNTDLVSTAKPVFDFLSNLSFNIKKDKKEKADEIKNEEFAESLEEEEPDEADADDWHNATGGGKVRLAYRW